MGYWRHLLVGLSLVILLAGSNTALAQSSKSYYYWLIDGHYVINKDTTVDVVETQTLKFTGPYHQVYRDISLNKVDAITDVVVYENGQPLKRSLRSLDKTQPASWGRYYSKKVNGKMHVEWYFDSKLPEDTRTWEIKYKVHGALIFAKNEHRFYWNVVDDYQMPVTQAKAVVAFAEPHTKQDVFGAWVYRDGDDKYWINNNSLIADTNFLADYFAPGQAFTIDVTFNKKLVDQKAYWFYWISRHYGYVILLLALLGAVGYIARYWYLKEYRLFKSRTVIAEYEPPENLPPGVMSMLVKERIAAAIWPATVIDLAVRGYVKIAETKIKRMFGFLPGVTDYRIEENRYSIDQRQKLHEYEAVFLDALLTKQKDGVRYFSTLEQSKDQRSQMLLRTQFITLTSSILPRETEKLTKGYIVPFKSEATRNAWLIIGFFVSFFIIAIVGSSITAGILSNQLLLTIFSGIFVFWLLPKITKSEVVLNEHGNNLKRASLGFKLYLETAEKYRLQNLTPDLFEKYLPYAMVFGIEKKWAEAFKGITISPPGWYSGGATASSVGPSDFSAGAFSASTFSSSFSSSFASAFSSSSGSGGGGGSAGGGGGGGGGGAS